MTTEQATFHMFSLRDLMRFVFCVLNLHVLHVQRITGFLNLNYPEINGVGKSDDMIP